LSTIPRESIDHIEITRGNSGGVLYGDGAVGGVINIVTKTGADLPPSARIAGTFAPSTMPKARRPPTTPGTGPGQGGRLGLRQRHQLRWLPHNNQLKQQNGSRFSLIGDQATAISRSRRTISISVCPAAGWSIPRSGSIWWRRIAKAPRRRSTMATSRGSTPRPASRAWWRPAPNSSSTAGAAEEAAGGILSRRLVLSQCRRTV